MRLANIDGRAVVLSSHETGFDVAEASDGAFGPHLPDVYDKWAPFREWAATLQGHGPGIDRRLLGPPSPSPRQVFAIGANYGKHVAETGREVPKDLAVFTKFPSCLAGPYAEITLRSDHVDWEAELVVVVGLATENVTEDDAWSHVAGLTVGQDLSERVLQRTSPRNQYSIPKSMPGFGPTGPCLITVDQLNNADDLGLTCLLNGQTQQQARTSDMIFSVPSIIARLSELCRLLPGDLIFTGSPAGVGAVKDPPRYLRDGDVLVSRIEGIGEMRNVFVDHGDRITYRA